MKFSIGTTNPYKIRELASVLNPLGIDLSVTDPIDPEETGCTLEENARIKAKAYGKHVGEKRVRELVLQRGCLEHEAVDFLKMSQEWIICEDSGISVQALNGLPGAYSARFSDCKLRDNQIVEINESGRTREEIDLANNQRLLSLMVGIKQPRRVASFGICLMVADTCGEVIYQTTKEKHGWIAEESRGSLGFGYDSIFISGDSFGKTWAEIDSMRKNLISHRRKTIQAFAEWLITQL